MLCMQNGESHAESNGMIHRSALIVIVVVGATAANAQIAPGSLRGTVFAADLTVLAR